jgi:DNA-binding response OmpR family regulator
MATSTSPAQTPPEPSRGTVLIADDDPEILTLLAKRLSKKGYKVLEASDGLQTLSVARAQRPDLVLLDVMMPGKNGWEVAREIRNDPSLADIGIVMLTAIGEKVNEMTSPLYGADDFVDKPFEFNDLEAKISRVITTRRQNQQGTGTSTPTSGNHRKPK